MRKIASVVGSVVLIALLGSAWPAQAGKARVVLGNEVRVQTPNSSIATCPLEGEPTVTVTSAGSWVAYNDDQSCPINLAASLHLTSLQLLPNGGGSARYVSFPPAKPGEFLSGDPALTPDPTHPGSVILATLYQYSAGLGLAAFRIDPNLRVSVLPSPTIDSKNPGDDKEFIASDIWSSSRYRGRTYLAWDDLSKGTVLRAFDHGAWQTPVVIAGLAGTPDVAVAPNGDALLSPTSVRGTC